MGKYVGQRIKRTEDPRFIKGLAHYVDDIRLPDTLHVAFVRSLYAHARINGIETAEAMKSPGVVAIYTGKEVASKVGPVPCAAALPDLKVPDYRVLATDKVLLVGHPIVAIVATDKYAARDAVDLISIDYEELPAALDVERAASGGAVIHEPFGNNIAYKLTSGEGDIDAAMKSADRIVSQKMIHQRLAPIAMEPRGVLARYFPGEEELTVWSSTQIPHLLRTQLALMIGFPENKLRVITPEVGGGFGSKLNVYAEEALVGWISVQLGKPVKWIESRRENLQSTIHGRAQVGTIEVGCKNDGTITGLRYNVIADLGAYHQLLTPAIPTLTGLMLSGAYRIPAIQMNVTGVFTNKMSTDAYRGAGRPEATYVVERAMDIVAAELKIDPVEVAFHKDWKPTRPGSRIPIGAAELDSIRTELAKLVQAQFVKALEEKGRYPVVNASGPDVLRVRIYIVNLIVNAPGGGSSSVSSRTFVMSAGEMTLFLDLYDSETGQILARVVDRREARADGVARMASRVTNIGEAQDIAAAWARILRDALDRATAR